MHESDCAFLNEVFYWDRTRSVAFGDVDDQPHVGLNEPEACAGIAFLRCLRQFELFIRAEQRSLRQFAEIAGYLVVTVHCFAHHYLCQITLFVV